MIDNWEATMEYFSDGVIPYSQYVWIVAIVALGIFALWKSRRMVSEL
jgi:hypothetical protein